MIELTSLQCFPNVVHVLEQRTNDVFVVSLCVQSFSHRSSAHGINYLQKPDPMDTSQVLHRSSTWLNGGEMWPQLVFLRMFTFLRTVSKIPVSGGHRLLPVKRSIYRWSNIVAKVAKQNAKCPRGQEQCTLRCRRDIYVDICICVSVYMGYCVAEIYMQIYVYWSRSNRERTRLYVRGSINFQT